MQSEQTADRPAIIGVDIGGTFTDIVYFQPSTAVNGSTGQMRVHKVPSTPENPAEGLLAGIQAMETGTDYTVIHGSTVATNALLERKGARAALITTEGFADVLEIGRQDRPSLYDLMQQRPPVLIPREHRLELPERLNFAGTVLRSPRPDEWETLLQRLAECDAESVAISLLYAFRNPVHEQELTERLRKRFPQLYVSLSSELLPQFREYERTSTVAVNAYVQPVMARYLDNLQERISSPLRIMQSSGGSISARIAAQEPVRTVLSGPAGGVIGAFHVARLAGYSQLITLDMGGTSTDVALCPGVIPETSEAVVAGCPVGVPTVAIHTVGAGGGSIVQLDAGHALTVGPQSAGAVPGPACYGKGDALTVTDANVLLGRIDPAYFLGGTFPLYPERSQALMEQLAGNMEVSVQEAALGIIRVINASMERALRTVSLEQGYDPRLFTLVPFGGAGPLHACELAESLRIPSVFIPRYPGVLSALGMILAPIIKDYVQTVMLDALAMDDTSLAEAFSPLETRALADVQHETSNIVMQTETGVVLQRFCDLRYMGQAYELTTPLAETLTDTLMRFHALHEQRFGHSHPDQSVQVVAVRLKAVVQPAQPEIQAMPFAGLSAEHAAIGERRMTFTTGEYTAQVYDRARLQHGNRISGPALLVQSDSTFLLPPHWDGVVDAWGNITATLFPHAPRIPARGIRTMDEGATVHGTDTPGGYPGEPGGETGGQEGETGEEPNTRFDPVTLEIFKHLFASAAEEMGVTLGRTAYSPNIKERKDYSCACFDASGRIIAQAEHIPVHLGAMPASVQAAIVRFASFEPGDIVILNDPYLGGTHLPDITLIAPVFIEDDPDGQTGALFGFVASRAHHADIGGMSPGSMPMSRELYQEGVIIPPLKLVKRGVVNEEVLELFYRNVRTPWERRGDMDAQIAAGSVGTRRLQEIIARYGSRAAQAHIDALFAYSAHLTRVALRQLPDHEVTFTDYLDDDGWGAESLPITVRMQARDGTLTIDFAGSAVQSAGCVNAVEAVTRSGVFYVVRCLVGEQVPVNQGCMEPVTTLIPKGSILHPFAPAAVAAGNVETSQRVVDALFGALAQLAPDKIPAASQGTMNNLTLGGYLVEQDRVFAYYETMGGGMGARPGANGLSGVHVHMSNTRNTPIEALEMELPLQVRRYALRYGSGGAGRYRGGDGLCRELQFLAPATVTLLTERRKRGPYGLHGGAAGEVGGNYLEQAGIVTALPGKTTFDVQVDDVLIICTPGGGGFLPEEKTDVGFSH